MIFFVTWIHYNFVKDHVAPGIKHCVSHRYFMRFETRRVFFLVQGISIVEIYENITIPVVVFIRVMGKVFLTLSILNEIWIETKGLFTILPHKINFKIHDITS